MDLTSRLHDVARSAGAVRSGVASAEAFDDVLATMETRLDDGTTAGLGFTYRDPVAATSPRATFPWARRIFGAAVAYLPEGGTARSRPGYGRVARFATADHYRPLRRVLRGVASVLEAEGHRAVVLVDDSRLVDRAVAVRAGVGWWGLSTMVLTPGAGPWTLLGGVLTDAELDESVPMERTCGTCRACLPACPTGALVAPGVLDARRCLAHVLQSGGVIPEPLRSAVGDRIYGCDDCLTACPPGFRLASRATGSQGEVDLVALLALDDRTLLETYAHFYLPGRRPRYLRRNAVVALGNWRDEGAVPILGAYVGGPDWMLRLHAAWALGQIGGRAAGAVLRAAARIEQDEEVGLEIRRALEQADPGGPRRSGSLSP